MDRKPKARGDARKTKQKIEDKAQSQRFIEAAHATGADESGESFERAVTVILKQKPKTTSRP